MRPPRYQQWTGRYIGERLGFGDELWDFPPDYPGFAELRRRRNLGRSADDHDLVYYASSTLILDIIEAAGAVEYAVMKLEAAAAEAQQWVLDNLPALQPEVTRPQYGSWAGAPSVRPAYLEFNSVVVWVRGIQDRMDRGAGASALSRVLRRIPIVRRRVPRRTRAGLINVLARGSLKDEVRRAHRAFRRQTGEARLLANFGLHAARVQQNAGSAAAEILDDGSIVLRIPDRVTRPVDLFAEFSFTQGRDALRYANELLAAVDALMEALLGAFERARPKRFS